MIYAYDRFAVGISGGKDSTATFLWALYESGIPRAKICAYFCDTGNEDPLTYAWIAYLSEHHPIERVEPEHDFFELAEKKKRFPSPKARFCTQHLKVLPSWRYLAQFSGQRVLQLSGVRQAEGTSTNNRARVGPFSYDVESGTWKYRPMYYKTLDDVWEIHRRHLILERVLGIVDADETLQHKGVIRAYIAKNGVPRNPLYDMGAARVGCAPCIMSRKKEIAAISRFRPQTIDVISRWEQKIDSTFFAPKKTPLSHRTKRTIARDGRVVWVPTVKDVARWSKTAMHRPHQFEMWLPEPRGAACTYEGACE